jgi:ketosteroid isomerase-like protein
MSDLEKPVARVLESYGSAVFARDVDALMRLYDPTVRVFDTWGVWQYEDAGRWRSAVEGWLGSLGAEKVKVTFEDVLTAGTPDLAIVSAIVTYAAISPQGETLRTMQNRLTWGLRTSGHVLRIVHEHTSAPIGFDDSKAMLQRQPGA